MSNDQEEKVVSKKKKIVSKITTIILASLAGLLILFQIIGLVTAKNNYGVQRFGNYQMLTVLTNSMEPTLPTDIGIIVKRVPAEQIKGPSSEDAMDGDIITYFRRSDGLIITHRVIEVIEQDGKFSFKTFGDNPNATTCSQWPDGVCDKSSGRGIDTISEEYVLGVYVRNSKVLGFFVAFSRKPWTIIIVGLVPLFYIFISSLFDISKNLKERKKEEPEVSVDFAGLDDFEKIKQQEKLKLLIEQEKLKLLIDEEKEKMRSSSEEERKDEDEK